jgi:predicted transcriptional regulator
MKCIWSRKEELTLPKIVALMNSEYQKNWKPQTVSTFLGRLVKKKYLLSQRMGRTFYYSTLIKREEYRNSQIDQCMDSWCNGSAAEFLASLYDRRELGEEEVLKIRGLLDEIY